MRRARGREARPRGPLRCAYETATDPEERGQGKAKPLPACVEEAIADFRPSAHVERLKLMKTSIGE